jgi:hypothetical protein
LLVLSFVVGGSPPDAGDSTEEVVGFWQDHHDAQIAAALLAGFAAVFLVWFGAVVRTMLRAAEGEPARLAATAFAGFLLIAAGGLALAGFQFTAADTVGEVPATVTHTLAALYQDFFFLLDGGVLVAVFATATATLRHRALPRWIGYLSIAVGLVFLTPVFVVAFSRLRRLDAPALGAYVSSGKASTACRAPEDRAVASLTRDHSYSIGRAFPLFFERPRAPWSACGRPWRARLTPRAAALLATRWTWMGSTLGLDPRPIRKRWGVQHSREIFPSVPRR